MRKQLFAALTAKTVAGVAAVAIATGSAGAVIATQSISDDTPVDTAETTELLVEEEEEATTTTTESTTTTTEKPVEDATDTENVARAADEVEDDAPKAAHPGNFGAIVSQDARDGGVDGQEISEAARLRNDARRATTTPDTDDDAAEAEDDDDEDDEPRSKAAEAPGQAKADKAGKGPRG